MNGRAQPGRVEALVFGIAIFVAAARMLIRAQHEQLFGEEALLLYQAATLGFNYFEFGAVRRGLGGSITYLLGSNLLVATAWFYLLSAAAMSALAAWNYRRLAVAPWLRLVHALVLVAIALRWAEDAGRTDVAVAALLAGAALAMARRRIDVAAAVLVVGLFVHESSLIFGLPLLLALVRVGGGWRTLDRPVLVRAGVVAGIGLLLYVCLGRLPHADTQFMVDAVRAKFPPHRYVDWAIYFATSGMRGVQTSICQNLADPTYFEHPIGGLLVLGVIAAALAWRLRDDLPSMALAALPGFVFLSIVANDIARWTMFAAFNAWLVAVSIERTAPRRGVPPWLALVLALSLVPLTHPKIFKIELPIYAGSPALEWVAQRLGAPRTPPFHEMIQQCDPRWREVLGDRP